MNTTNTPEDEALIGYLNHFAKLWNIEELKGNPEQIENTKKVISCYTDPRNTWFTRTRQGLCREARLTPEELEEVLELNASTFMISDTGKIVLRLKLLNLTDQAIIHYYKLDEF